MRTRFECPLWFPIAVATAVLTGSACCLCANCNGPQLSYQECASPSVSHPQYVTGPPAEDVSRAMGRPAEESLTVGEDGL